MNKEMKVMIAYDGSGCADAAIDDLGRAGLPPTGEALVVSVADVSKTAIADFHEIGVLGKFVSPRLLNETVALTQKKSARARNEAKKTAMRGCERVRSKLPGWLVNDLVAVGNPAEELLREAAEWQPDLTVAGSHGRSAIGRFFLGSVSIKLAEEANCSVRVARRGFEKDGNTPTKIIVGAITLPDVELVVRAVGRRVWSVETEMRLVTIDDGVSPGRVSAVYPYAKAIYELSVDDLRAAAGLQVSVVIKSGDPKIVLLEEAENWAADTIFVIAGGGGDNIGLNETAANLITDANCTVEAVR